MAHKILVPIDFSEFNKKVIAKAVDYAKLTKGEIYLIHVASLDIGIIVSETGFTYLPELEDTALSYEAEKMSALKDEIEEEGITCYTIVKQGIPADVILDEVKEINADIIVIGSLGHNALYKVFIGSVASNVIKYSTIPLLVVPKEKKEKEK